jgi:hypothetical protein
MAPRSSSMACALIALMAASVAPSAPAPKSNANHYYPTRPGDKSVFERTGKDAGGESTDEFSTEVTAAETTDGLVVVTIRRAGPPDVRGEGAVRVTAKGLYARAGPDGAFDRCLLKLPATKGETWELASVTPGSPKTVYMTVGEEEIEVPAGKFRAVRVDSKTEYPKYTAKDSVWYAPGVGVVKRWYNSGVGEVFVKLKSFTPGK